MRYAQQVRGYHGNFPPLHLRNLDNWGLVVVCGTLHQAKIVRGIAGDLNGKTNLNNPQVSTSTR